MSGKLREKSGKLEGNYDQAFLSEYCKYYKSWTGGCAKLPEAIIRLCIVLQNFDI